MLDSRGRAWLEMSEDRVVVSWPYGHEMLTYGDDMESLIGAIREAVDDLIATRPEPKDIKDGKRHEYDRGWKAGWEAGKASAA